MAGFGGGMADPRRDRPHGVSSGLFGFDMAASDPENLYEPPSTIRPVRGHRPAEGHAGVGGKGPALHVCTGPEGSGGRGMHIRPQSSGYLGVDPPPPCSGTGCGEFPRRRWIPRDNDSLEGPTCSSSWPNHAPGQGSGKSMPQRSYPSPRYAGWVKYHPSAGRTSPRWELRTRGSSGTIARSHDWDRTRRPGLRGSAGLPPVRHQHWDGQRISKWVRPSSCRGLTGQRPGGMPGDERAQPTSVGWGFRGDTSCGGAGGIASKLPTCTPLPQTNLNVCRLRDCLGQPLKEFAGERPTSGTSGRPASWSSSKMTRESAHPRRRPSGHDPQVGTTGPKRREPR